SGVGIGRVAAETSRGPDRVVEVSALGRLFFDCGRLFVTFLRLKNLDVSISFITDRPRVRHLNCNSLRQECRIMPATGLARDDRTALVVEDEPLVMAVVTAVLLHNGYQVLPATNAQQGEEIFHRHNSELSLLIINMALPRTNGLDFIHHLPTLFPRIPV